MITAYLAPRDFVAELESELGDALETHDRLVLAPGPPREVAWAQNVWHEPRRLTIASIGDAVKQLRAIQRNWAHYSTHAHRRAHLIEEQLPHVAARRQVFGEPPPAAHLGSWTLLDEHTLLAAPRCSSPYPNGDVEFVEDKSGPPNRAYLKLWEAFTLLGVRPAAGERCLDLGSSPGGWTWVLSELGCRVVSVDGAPLAPSVATRPGVQFLSRDAFSLDPAEIGPVDWLFSDVVCYPDKLLELVRRWLDSGQARRFVCTIKFQGPTDHAVTRSFLALPGSRAFHFCNNKHELTWVKL